MKLPVRWMSPESAWDGIFTEKSDVVSSVADMVASSGGFRNLERGVRARKFLDCHAHFRSRWKSELNISKQL